MARAYLTPTRLAALTETLTDRDLSILASVRRLRVLTGLQLERLHFSSDMDQSRQRRRVLARLVEQRLLSRLGRRIGGVRAGSAGFCYSLGVAGQHLAGFQQRQRPSTPGIPFLTHALAISELFVRLTEGARSGDFELLNFVTEPACWRHFTGTGGGRVTLKPDAYIATATDELERYWFVEVDQATQSATTIARKCDSYRAYWASGKEEAQLGLFPRVLFTAPDVDRRSELLDVLGRQSAETWELYQAVHYDEAAALLAGGKAS